MLNALPPIILLDVAIFFTALAWALGFYIADRRIYVFEPAAIGCLVCLLGYSVQSLGAPIWAVVAAPIPLDIFLLWYVLRKPGKMAIAYISTWAVYFVFHMMLSAGAHYDSLIPAWKLHR